MSLFNKRPAKLLLLDAAKFSEEVANTLADKLGIPVLRVPEPELSVAIMTL